MDNAPQTKDTFDFTNIFPQCQDGFQWINFTPHGELPDKLTSLCSDFNLNYRTSHSPHPFVTDCRLVTYYLKHIQNKEKNIILNACCKYFFYKLKNLLKKFPSTCQDTKSCYEAIKSLSCQKKFNEQISPLFSLCDSKVSDSVEKIFHIFERIDYTYDNLSLLISNKRNPVDSKFKNFKSGMNYLEGFHNMYNDSFKELLINFNNYYLEYVKKLNQNDSSVKAFMSYRSNDGDITGVLKVLDKKPQMHAITGTDTAIDTSTVSITNNGAQRSTGICFLFFTILIIMFILYKVKN
ncbi:variable surface protein, partial [Plasmodium gonderi]